MKIERRFVKSELGSTLPLAMMMVVIIGVMGAGLLTFVGADLNTVIETNRGQRAFELADAGVAAAKSQLLSHCQVDPENCETFYDGGNDDILWSTFYPGGDPGGVGITLTDLDGSATTPNKVEVAIEHRPDTDDFKVISTGYYGVAKRKIEAILEGIVTFGGGQGGYPLYYTPSDIRIEAENSNARSVLLRDISVFAGGDILLEGLLSRAAFITEMGDNNNQGRLRNTGKSDSLGDWCTTVACNTGGNDPFRRIPANWNTQERKEGSADLLEPGLAAAGKICGFATPGTNIGTCGTSPSIADGVYGYDCTTGPVPDPLVNPDLYEAAVCPTEAAPRGNGLTFVDKEPEDKNPNDANTITFPFPRPVPVPETLHENARATFTCPAFSTNCSPPWSTLIAGRNDIVFIDANNSTVNYNASGTEKGLLVVWCGHLNLQSPFKGVIMNLNGMNSNGDGNFGGSECTDDINGGPDMTKGTFTNQGQIFSGWLYAEGGTDQKAGIVIQRASQIEKFPGGKWSFEMDALENAPPTDIAVRGWRELYQ